MRIKQIANMFVLAALTLVSACHKPPTGPTPDPGPGPTPSPTGPVYISIPAPIQGQLDKAFLRFHRPSDQPITNPAGLPDGFVIQWTEPGQAGRRIFCDNNKQGDNNLDWNSSQQIQTCLMAFDGDNKLLQDTEIWIWAVDWAFSPINLGHDIMVKGTLIPTKMAAGIPWPVGYCKLHADGTPYW